MTITTLMPEKSWMRMIAHTTIQSPLGPLFLAATDVGLCALEYIDSDEDLETYERSLARRFGQIELREDADRFDIAVRQLADYFKGELRTFEMPIDFGTVPAFSQRVWERLIEIPYGRTTAYGTLAASIGSPEASRAVGLAAGTNPVAIVVPCHRVIAKDGSLIGYSGGLERKRWLLTHENAIQPDARIGTQTAFGWP